MKKLLLTITLSLISFNLSAVEHVIGFGGYYGNYKSEIVHSSVIDYLNPNFDPSKPIDGNNKERITDTFAKNITNTNKGYDFSFEYQARFDDKIILGIGFENNVININPDFQSLENIKYQSNTPYFTAMIVPYKNKYLSTGLGVSSGINFIRANSQNYTKPSFALLGDVEFNLSKTFILFSRVSYNITEKFDIISDTNLVVDVPFKDINALNNWLQVIPKDDTFNIKLGVRYKI